MILREEPGGGVLAVTQPAHAALAGRLAGAWDDDLAGGLVTATHRHDDVWAAWDASPRWSAATGRPLSFIELAPGDRVAIWSRAAATAAPHGPEVELWVLRHAERLHARADDARLKAMTAAISARISDLVGELRAAHGTRFDDAAIARGTSLLGLFDTISLAVCSGVEEPRDAGVLRLAPAADGAVTVAPWPFAGGRVATSVEARRLPGRLAGQAELDAVWAAAAPFALPVTLVRA